MGKQLMSGDEVVQQMVYRIRARARRRLAAKEAAQSSDPHSRLAARPTDPRDRKLLDRYRPPKHFAEWQIKALWAQAFEKARAERGPRPERPKNSSALIRKQGVTIKYFSPRTPTRIAGKNELVLPPGIKPRESILDLAYGKDE